MTQVDAIAAVPVLERAVPRSVAATHMLHPDEAWGDPAIRRRKVGVDRIDEFLMLKRADIWAKGTADVASLVADVDIIEARLRSEIESGSALSRSDLAVDGTDLCAALGREPGPWLRAAFDSLLEWVIEDPQRNESDQLITRVQQLNLN